MRHSLPSALHWNVYSAGAGDLLTASADEVREIEPPTSEELTLLRRLDPHQFYLVPGRY